MLEAVGEVFPEVKYQRCTVHFYRNVFSVTPRSKVKLVAKMLKAIHAQESKKAAREKAKTVVEELRSMKLKEAAKKMENGIEETLIYCDFPSEHWTRIRTNNVIERLNREIRRRTRVVGSFPEGFCLKVGRKGICMFYNICDDGLGVLGRKRFGCYAKYGELRHLRDMHLRIKKERETGQRIFFLP